MEKSILFQRKMAADKLSFLPGRRRVSKEAMAVRMALTPGTLNPPNESLDKYLSDKFAWNKFVMKTLNDQVEEKV